MGKLPLMSGRAMVQILEKIGYYVVRQRGSHIRLYHIKRCAISVPDHYEVGRGIIRKILRDAGISEEEFLELLK